MNTMVEHINSAGHIFVEFALPMLVQSGVLIVILLLADLLLRKKVKAVFRYWIWMLVLVKLVLPTSLSSPLSLGYLFGDKLTYQDLAQSSPTLEPTVPAPADISPGIDPLFIQPNPYIPPTEPVISVFEPMIAEPVSPPEVPVTPLSWQGVVFLVWLAVVIAMGLLLLQRAFFVRGLVAQSKEAGCLMNDALAYCCASMGIKSKVGLKVSVNATTPSVCGLIRPVILVPWNLASTLGASRLRTVLMHELAHIKRADLWVNLAQTVLQIIYFYNLLLWLANCVIRRIREQAVDEAVLVAMGEKAQRYPQMLVDVAKMAFKRPALSLRLIGVVESKSALAGRIKHILGRPIPKTAKLGIVGVLTVIIAGAILLPMAAGKDDEGAAEDIAKASEFMATLPNGVTVELVGVCEHPSEGKKWWKPDGDELLEAPYDEIGGNVYPDGDEKSFEFAIRLGNLTAEHVNTKVGCEESVGGSAGGSSSPQKNGEYLSDFRWLATTFPKKLKACTVKVGVAAGQWQPVAESNGKGFGSRGSELGGVSFTKAFEVEDGISITVADDILGRPCRVVAITNDGEVVKPVRSSGSSAGKARQTTAKFNNISLSDIKEFQFQTRPYEWVEFKSVSLKPGFETDVQVEGEITKDLGCFKGLEFRIVPVSVESGSIQGPLTPEQEQVYRNLLKEYGPNRPYNKSDQYIWLPAEEDIKTNTAITGEFEKQKYILVSNKPDEIMLYDGSWHVTFIDRQRDNERAVKYHSVVAGFDEYGKHLFSSLTNNHIGRTLAIIRDNKVVFASTIQRRMYQAAITGNFTEKQTAPLMVMFGQYLQVQHERKPFLWDIDRQAWREYIEATEALAKGQDRAKLAKTFLTIGSKHPQATHCQTATELGRLLESMFKEDKQFEEPEDVEALNQSKQVEYYIYKLRDVTEQDIFVPGKIHFLRDYTRMDTPVTALRKMGKDVVPVMIKHLKDRRPTRSVGSLPNGGAVTRNCDVALEIIESIAGRKFDFRTSRGTYLSTASERLRDKIIEDVKQWWQKNKQKTDVQVEGEQSKASPESKTTEPVAQEPVKQRGGISGIVVHSITGKPIAGAYVGVGDFGDSGGSNYSRHRSEGFHDKTKTDEQGRFELGGLVFTDKHRYLEYHPLVVTHPDFVRHDEKIELLSSGPVPDVKITLRPAAKIDITIVDAQGNPLEGQWLIRLEALDGRRFIPPGSDPHLSSFASSIWAHMPDLRARMGVSNGFTFTELDTGEYSIEAIRFHLVDNPTPQNIWKPTLTYHGSIPSFEIQAGRTKEVRIKPADYQTSVSINMPEDPIKKPQIPPFVIISRNTGLLLWNDGKAHGPEDHRLGRLQKNAFFYTLARDGDVFTIKNLPPGSYSVFAGPIYFMSATRMEVSRGREVVVDMPPIQITEHAKVGLWTFDRKVKLEARDYSVSELCELLTAMTESNPRIIADSLIENEKLRFGKGEMSVWDVLEKLYLDKGWRLDEGQDKTLIIRPADKTDVPVEVEGAGEKVSQFIGTDLPDSVQNVKFHSGSFAESSRTLIRFDVPLPDLKNLLAKSDKLPDFPDLHKNPKIQRDMVEAHKALNVEWWKPDELESPNCATWIKSNRAKGAPKVWVVNILNICCSRAENNLMRVYIDFFSHAH